MSNLPPHIWISLQKLEMNSHRLPTTEDLKTQYRQLAKCYHPDAGGDGEKMKTINRSYKVVHDWIARMKR